MQHEEPEEALAREDLVQAVDGAPAPHDEQDERVVPQSVDHVQHGTPHVGSLLGLAVGLQLQCVVHGANNLGLPSKANKLRS